MSMLKSHCLLPKIAMLFFGHPDIRVSRAGSQLKIVGDKLTYYLCQHPEKGNSGPADDVGTDDEGVQEEEEGTVPADQRSQGDGPVNKLV